MANYLILSVQQVIDCANGKTIQTYTGPGSGYGTNNATYSGEVQALNALAANGFTLVSVSGYGPMKEYYLTHA